MRALALALLLGGCMTAKDDARPLPVDLYFRGLSYFHGDGSRLVYHRSGLLVLDTLGRTGGALVSRRQVVTLPDAQRQALASWLDGFDAASVKTTQRLGIPDEVRDRVAVRGKGGALAAWDVWHNDLPQQGPAFQEVMARVSTLLAAVHDAPARDVPVSTEVPWPSKFEPEP